MLPAFKAPAPYAAGDGVMADAAKGYQIIAYLLVRDFIVTGWDMMHFQGVFSARLSAAATSKLIRF